VTFTIGPYYIISKYMGWSTNENLRKIIAVNNYLRREEHT
jgi:hypothetical protein